MTTRNCQRRRRALAFVSLTLIANPAMADETRTEPAPGMVHVHRSGDSSLGTIQDYHLVFVDLAVTDVTFSPESRRGASTSSLARAAGAAVAVNANFFDSQRRPCGVAQSNGTLWANAYEGCPFTLGFGPGLVVLEDMAGRARGPWPAPWTDVVRHAGSGKPRLLANGKRTTPYTDPSHMLGPEPRTAVGLTQDHQTLVLLVVDGRRVGASGMTGDQLATVLEGEGAWDALNFDGGGSSTLWIAAEGGVVNHPSDGAERAVANALLAIPR